MSDDYSRALARTAVGQLAELAGYESVQDSATDILSELLLKYITELSTTAHGYAELANRTACNLHDMLLALDDLGTSVPELQAYLKSLSPEDNTFAHVLTDYPIRKPGRPLPTWHDKKEEPPAHIPAFLPAFPDKHTYQATPTYPGHETNPDKQAKAIQKARRQAESSLLKLHHSTSAAAKAAAKAATSNKAGAAAGAAAAAKAGASAPAHPFLEPPSVLVVHVPKEEGGADGHVEGPQQPTGGSAVVPGGTSSTAQIVQGTGAYEAHVASKAFSSVLGSQGGEDGSGQAEGNGVKQEDGLGFGEDDIMAPEELSWRYQPPLDNTGALKRPLGTSFDYTSAAFAASQMYTVGRIEPDAYDEAAKEAAAGTATGRKRNAKSIYGNVERDPVKKKAQEILERAKDLNGKEDQDE